MAQTSLESFTRANGAPRRSFARDVRGGIALIFAIALVPIAIAAGSAVDMGRAYVVRSRLSYALDAAGLAVGSAATTDPDELEVILQDYFDANYPDERMGIPAAPTMTIDGNEIHLSVTAELPTTLMNVIGIHELTVGTSAVIIKETKGLEVVLVLDITGSMIGSKLESLIEASHTFIDILFGDEETNDKLKIGIVPFNMTVNVGTDMVGYVKNITSARFSPTTWKGCVEARPGGQDTTDAYTASNTASSGRWRAYSWPSSAAASNLWPPVTGLTGPNRRCPDAEIMPLTSTKSPLHDRIDELEAEGNTHIPIGAVWGWRVLSPTEPYTEGVAYNDEEFSKAIVIMTDGENIISTNTGQYSGYGTVSQAQSKLGCSSSSCMEGEMDDRLLEVCDAMKALDILVYTIGFDLAGSSNVLDLLEDCATDPSKFFDSPGPGDLQSAFTTIGAELSNLRIGQ